MTNSHQYLLRIVFIVGNIHYSTTRSQRFKQAIKYLLLILNNNWNIIIYLFNQFWIESSIILQTRRIYMFRTIYQLTILNANIIINHPHTNRENNIINLIVLKWDVPWFRQIMTK